MKPTPEQQRKFQLYWVKCQAKLHLVNWHTEFKYTKVKDYFAQVSMSNNCVTLFISSKFWKADAQTKRWIIAHEMVHMWLHNMTDLTGHLCAGWMPSNTWTMVHGALGEAEETVAEGLGRVLAELLPPWKD